MQDISQIRKELDKLDRELMRVLARRMTLIPHVAEYKQLHDLPVQQEEREEEIIQSKRRLAEKLKLNPDFIEDILRRIIREASEMQEKILKS